MQRPLLAALAVTLPAVALAVGLGDGPTPSLIPASVRPQPLGQEAVAVLGPAGHKRMSLQGLVMEVDVGSGRLLLEVEGEQELLYGTPPQLTGLSPGDAVAARARSYGEQSWLWPPADDADGERFTTFGVLTGPVGEVRRADGRLEIGGEVFSAHPAALAPLAPGLRVSVRYAIVDGERWALAIDAERPSIP